MWDRSPSYFVLGSDRMHERTFPSLWIRRLEVRIAWDEYAERFLRLMAERDVATIVKPSDLTERTVLLCSEAGPERCHRRLLAEHLSRLWGDADVVHL
ncbi:MAG: DUF488 domain-containing protein [Chloroflexi bacterium]|nr:DUF488 domain-containing protein [Chloroflexota bacterium]